MIILRNLIWVWTISYIIDLLWYKFNPDFIEDHHRDNYHYFDYDFYKMFLYVVTLIAAPLIASVIIASEIYLFFRFLPRRIKLWITVSKIKDKEARKLLKRELRNL